MILVVSMLKLHFVVYYKAFQSAYASCFFWNDYPILWTLFLTGFIFDQTWSFFIIVKNKLLIKWKNPRALASILSNVCQYLTEETKQERVAQFPVRQIGQIRSFQISSVLHGPNNLHIPWHARKKLMSSHFEV